MTLTTTDAEILVTGPHSSGSVADFRVPASDIQSVDVEERAGRDVAQGTIVIDNSDRAYTSGRFPIDFDDELEFRVAWEGAGLSDPFGQGPFGQQAFGTTEWTTAATLIVTSWQPSGLRHTSTLVLNVEQFVFNRLAEQTVNEYRALDAPIAGSSDAHLDTILADYVPSVGASQLPTISETIDYSVDKKTARKVVADLARLAHDATGTSWLVGADGTDLTLTDVGSLAPQWTADAGQTDFKGSLQHSASADDLVNDVRVEGGVDPQNIDDQQTTHDTSSTVTDSSRLSTRVDSRKAELPRIQIYTIAKSGSDDDLRVRLQADDGAGNPINATDTDSDIINQTKTVPDGYDDWLTFQLGEHTIAPRERPHLIIDATGSDGQNVGQNSANSDPAYKVHFSKPVIVSVPDGLSQDRYREHDETISDDNLRSFNAARNRARAELDRRALPKLTFGPATAESRRAHDLAVSDAITLDYPWLRAEGDYVVTGVSHSYEAATLETEVELRSIARFA